MTSPKIETRGRPLSTTRDAVARAALDLFTEAGFDEVTMSDIADAVGVSRRTVFRYYASKNDIVWGDFDHVRARLRGHLNDAPADEPYGAALRRAVVLSNRYPPEQLPELRVRMALITSTPALQSHSMVRYEEWCTDVAAFVAARLGVPADDLAPLAIANATMATAMSAFRHWVSHPEEDLEQDLDRALALVIGPLGAGGQDAGHPA